MRHTARASDMVSAHCRAIPRDYFQGDEPEYPPDQVEILSDQHLVTTLGYEMGMFLSSYSLLTREQKML